MIPLRACLVLSLLLLTASTDAAIARWRVPVQQYVVPRAPQLPITVVPQRPREDRVIELPEDGGLFHLAIVGEANDPRAVALRQFIDAAPRLASVKRQVKYYDFPTSHYWAQQYFPAEPKPLIVLQDDRGQVLYKASGTNLPRQAEELADEVEYSIRAYAADCGPNCRPSKTRPAIVIPDTRQGSSKGLGIELQDVIVIALVIILALVIWRVTR